METLLCLLPLTVLATLLRRARRPARPSVAVISLPSPPARHAVWRAPGPRLRLVGRATLGALLALALLVLALLPWPTAWSTAAALATSVSTAQALARDNIDLVTIVAVITAIAEPAIIAVATRCLHLLQRLVQALVTLPRCTVLLARLAWLSVRITTLRLRNWRQARHCMVATTSAVALLSINPSAFAQRSRRSRRRPRVWHP
jgi:hypothetical protein